MSTSCTAAGFALDSCCTRHDKDPVIMLESYYRVPGERLGNPNGPRRGMATRCDSSHQRRGDRRAEVPARLQVGFGRLPHHHHGLGSLHPTEPGRDRIDTPLGSLGALVAMDIDAVGSPTSGVEKLIVGGVERVL